MTTTPSRPPAVGEVTPLTVHGPWGVVDLTVPTRAELAAVAREYAAQAGLARPPALASSAGTPLAPTTVVEDAGLVPGSVVVALDPQTSTAATPGPHDARGADRGATPPATWCGSAALFALGAGVATAWLPYGSDRLLGVALLMLGAVLGCLPVGVLARHRASVAPAFAAAACFAWFWQPASDQLAATVGVAALAAAVTAAVASLFNDVTEVARVWMVAGGAVFVVTTLGTVTDRPPNVAWAVLLLGAVLAARWVPLLAISVPDRYLLDLERLATTAWSAHDAAPSRRPPPVVPAAAVAEVAARGGRLVIAGTAAVALVAAAAAPLLLWTAQVRIDQIGARCLVGFGGAALLLAARSHRHPVAKRLLRLGGIGCLVSLAVVLAMVLDAEQAGVLAGLAVLVALVLLLAAVLVGRGWRSTWWSRNADVAELICGAVAIGAVVVATGLFRYLWTTTS